jgi:hypothetical protein
MTTPFGSWLWFDMGSGAKLTNADVIRANAVMPVAGTIKSVIVGAMVALTTGGGTLGVYKYVGTVSANILSAATVDLQADITAGVGAARTLTTAPTTLRVAAGDIIAAVWTLTTVGTTGHACLVAVEPDYW